MAPTDVFASSRIHHVALRVADARAATDWYVGTLGLVSVREFPFRDLDIVFLAAPGGTGTVIELIGGGSGLRPLPYENVTGSVMQLGLGHLCLEVADLDAVMAAMRESGVPVVIDVMEGAAGAGIAKGAFITDPWDNIIELVEPLPQV